MQYKHISPVIVGLLSLFVGGCSKPVDTTLQKASYAPRSQQMEVEVASVERQAISAEQEFTGNLLPRRMTRIMAEVNGVVKDIPRVGAKFDVELDGKRYSEQLSVTFGQVVHESELLIQLDPRDFEIELQITQAKLAKASADLAKLLAWERGEEIQRLAAIRNEFVARSEQSQRNLARLEKLLPSNAISQAEFEQAEMEVSSAKAMVDSAEASLAAANAGPTVEEVAVQQALVAQAEAEVEQKKWQLAKTAIRAPYDGVVTSINVELGERVSTAGEPLVELMNLRYLIAEIGIPEAYVGSIQLNDQATVLAAGTPQAITGLVVAVNEMVDPATRTFKVRVAIDNANGQFKAGQFATVRLSMSSSTGDSLVAPSQALVFLEGEPHVFVVEGDKVRKRAIQPGVSNQGMLEVLGGLQLGETIVIDDPSLLSDGMQIVVKSATEHVAFFLNR